MSLLRFTRTSQPQQPVGIDWSNPITRGLQECVTPQSLLTNVNGATKVATLTGAGLKGDGTSSYFWRPYTGAKITTAGTIFCIVNGATAAADARIFSLGSSASSTPTIALQSSGSSAIRGGAFNRAGGQNTLDSGITAFESGVPHTLASAFGGGLNKLFQDGIFRQSVASTNDFSSYTLDRVAVGCLLRSTAGSFNSAAMLLGLIWNRALSDAEIKSLSDNPWQVFLPTNRAIYPEATAAGSTYTLTADAASYSITGADASLIATRKLIADTANIPIAGADATLTYTPIGGPTYTLTADAGSIAVNGNAATLAFNRVLTADAGSYSVAGQAVGLAFNRVLSASTANIPVAGQDVTLTYTNNGFTYTLSAEAGAFSVTGQDARLVWSGEQTGFTNEVILKPWYIRRNKKILLFGTAQEADAYIEAEEVAEQAIQEAQKTSRRARKRLREKLIKVEPIQTVDVDQLAEAIERFSIPVDLPKLIAQQDYERVMQILALAADMQDEEDVEMLLLM